MTITHDATTTATYPTFGDARPGSINLRTYDDSACATRSGDVAAIAAERLGAGHHVAAICAETRVREVIACAGYGWNHPTLQVSSSGDLLGVTAELYRAWVRAGDRPLTVIVDDIQGLGTGFDLGHDDAVMVAWIAAVRRCDLEDLAHITGLDFERYTRRARPDALSTPALFLGTRRRKNGSGISGIMGGAATLQLADSIVAVTGADLRHGQITARAELLKHRYIPVVEPVTIQRSPERNDHWHI